MVSLQFFDHSLLETNKIPLDWGTGESLTEKFDPTIIKAPTYLTKKQPIEQTYYKSNLELSNLRLNDQLIPNPLKENLLEKQIREPFPMNHPMTSHISFRALIPNYTAPEDLKRGEQALRASNFVFNEQTPAQVDNTIVIGKTHGNPWRHEAKVSPGLPTQRQGIWYPDQQYFHVPKPDDQTFYPYPPTILAPNPRLRPEQQSIDLVTANVLKNKEKQLMQTTHQTDYFKDGLGTQAPLNSDDLTDKKIKYETTGVFKENMKPYFKRGTGISLATITPFESNIEKDSVINEHMKTVSNVRNNNTSEPKLQTKLEKDELEMENGRDYKNYPESKFSDNLNVSTYSIPDALTRSKTMPNINFDKEIRKTNIKNQEPANKLDAENRKLIKEHHERIQKLQLENRHKEINLITPDRDVRLLKLKYSELEKSPCSGAKPILKQNVSDHVNTFYQQESKYLGERADLYKTSVYNPYLLKQYVESVKVDPKVSATFTSGTANLTKANFSMLDDTYEHRPKLFAHKVFNDYELVKRIPLEQILTNPQISATIPVQENGIILQQSTYGDSYNTKKYLQEHELNRIGSESLYRTLDPVELDYQNITLKSKVDDVALANYKSGSTANFDLNKAKELVDINEESFKEAQQSQYPRLAGPMPPEPYEPIYCTNQITEMSDGNSKRYYSRVYESPFTKSQPRYEPLRADLNAMSQYEAMAVRDSQDYENNLRKLQKEQFIRSKTHDISFPSKATVKEARRSNDKTVKQLQEQQQQSTYKSNYTPYTFESPVECPPNEYYKSIGFTEPTIKKLNDGSTPRNLISLQDGWSKSSANKIFNATYQSKMPDLRQNITTGKKIIYESPMNAHKFSILNNY